jgi:hypothetical protein
MSNVPGSDGRRGYPLAVLFVLVTGCAALIAAVAPVVQHLFKESVDGAMLAWALAGGSGLGLVLGLVIGSVQHGWRLGLTIGGISGLLLGLAGGVLALAPANQLPRAAVTLVVGSGLMIGVAIFTRQRR